MSSGRDRRRRPARRRAADLRPALVADARPGFWPALVRPGPAAAAGRWSSRSRSSSRSARASTRRSGSLETWRKRSNDASYALLAWARPRLTLPDGGFARRRPAGSRRASRPGREPGRRRAGAPGTCRPRSTPPAAAGRRSRPAASSASTSRAGGRSIDGLRRDRGRGLRRADAGRRVAVLERSFGSSTTCPTPGRSPRRGRHRALRRPGALA